MSVPRITENVTSQPHSSQATLRDEFAMRAMAAMAPIYWEEFESYPSGAALNKCLSETAYEMADAMLAERAK